MKNGIKGLFSVNKFDNNTLSVVSGTFEPKSYREIYLVLRWALDSCSVESPFP